MSLSTHPPFHLLPTIQYQRSQMLMLIPLSYCYHPNNEWLLFQQLRIKTNLYCHSSGDIKYLYLPFAVTNLHGSHGNYLIYNDLINEDRTQVTQH